MPKYKFITQLRTAVAAYRGGLPGPLFSALKPFGAALEPYSTPAAEYEVPHLVRPARQITRLAIARKDERLLTAMLGIAPPFADAPDMAVQAALAPWRAGFTLLRPLAANPDDGVILGMPLFGAFLMGAPETFHFRENLAGDEEELLEEFVDQALAAGATPAKIRAFMRRDPGGRQGAMWPHVVRMPRSQY